jgi:OFA family oxalate/formate antiporter-like MFS transporter
VFRVPLSIIHPDWVDTELSTIFTISIICFCFGGFISGKIVVEIGFKIVLLVAALLLFAGFYGASMAVRNGDSKTALMLMYVFYGVFCGLGAGIGYNSVIGTTIKWFPDMAGIASGVMLIGFGCGGLVLGSFAMQLIEALGVSNTLFYFSLSISPVILISAFVISRPSEAGTKPIEENDAIIEAAIVPLSSLQMIKTGEFWLFFSYAIFACSAGLVIINSGSVIAVSFGAPAVIGLLVSVFNGAGRIVIGFLFDKRGRYIAMITNAIFLLFCGVMLLLCSITKQTIFILIGLPLIGLPYGGTASLVSAVTHSLFGSKFYAENAALMMFHMVPATVIGPIIYDLLFKWSGRTYHLPFTMIIIFALGMITMNAILTKNLLRQTK